MSGVRTIPPGTHGFDCNTVLSAPAAAAFFKHGYRFAVRYIPRTTTPHAWDISLPEIERLHTAGLAVMPVQHVESDSSWLPTLQKGVDYGRAAVAACCAIRIPRQTTVWLDLEGVDRSVPASTIIAYCNAWFTEVAVSGFTPGIYIGWHCGLTPDELYARLKFRQYWGAYNLNADQEPAKRGLMMRQHAAKPADRPAGLTIAIDTDTVNADRLGDLPFAFAPDEWSVGV